MKVIFKFNLGLSDLSSRVYVQINEQRKITYNNERTEKGFMILLWVVPDSSCLDGPAYNTLFGKVETSRPGDKIVQIGFQLIFMAFLCLQVM